MSLLTNRSNLRSDLKIDPNGRVWSDATLNRYLNEGQREVINDPDADWQFMQTVGYLTPSGIPEYIEEDRDAPEKFFPKHMKQMTQMWASNGSYLDMTNLPEITGATAPSANRYSLYAERLWLNAGVDSAASYTTLHNMDTFDGDGTWVGVGDTINVATDAVTYKEGSGSVSFDIDVSASSWDGALLTNSTMTAVDISSYILDESAIILWVYLPDATNFESVSIYFGSDSSNYYSSKSNFTDAQGNKYKDGWNRIIIPTINKTTTGTPDMSSVGYLRIIIAYSNSQTDQTSVRVDNIQIVDKYIRYMYLLNATDLSADTDESAIPSQYQPVYEKYAAYKAWSVLSGRENMAQMALQEYNRMKNKMKRELLWSNTEFYKMRLVR